jgi:hypothetical protein
MSLPVVAVVPAEPTKDPVLSTPVVSDITRAIYKPLIFMAFIAFLTRIISYRLHGAYRLI